MQILRKKIIISVIIITGLIIRAESTYAIYSPRINQQASQIKANIISAKKQNGTGTIMSVMESLLDKDKRNRAKGQSTGLSSKATMMYDNVMRNAMKEFRMSPIDAIFMTFNILPSANFTPISNCLRDDIWELENLRDAVVREMIKAYLLYDAYNGDKLKEDYKYLIKHINILKTKGMYGAESPQSKITVDFIKDGVPVPKQVSAVEYLFGSPTARNYYKASFPSETGCPDGEFEAAFKQVVNSIKNIAVLSSGKGSDWGSIIDMAKAGAHRKADEWIKSNQVALTIGGKEGGSTQSLIKGGGWDRFVGQVNTQIAILKNMIGPLTPLFTWSIYLETKGGNFAGCSYYYPENFGFRACTSDQLIDFKQCIKDKKKAETKGIDCTKFRNTENVLHYSQRIKDYEEGAKIHREVIKASETAFVYHTQLNSVAENNIYDTKVILEDINMQIKRGYEGLGKKGGPGLPTLLNALKTLEKKHCANR